MDFLDRNLAIATGVRQGGHLGPLDVGSIRAVGGFDENVLAGIGGDHELVRHVAADRAAVCLHRNVRQAAALVDAAVGGVHFVVARIQPVEIDVEGIGVLH